MDRSLREVLQVFKKKIWIIFLVAMLGAGGMGAYTYFLVAPEYTAKATFYVTNTDKESTSISFQDINASKSLVDTYITIIKSNSTLSQVVESLPEYNLTEQKILDIMNISAVNETEIFEVAITCTDPVEARDIVDSIVDIAPKEIVRVIRAGAVSIVDSVELPTTSSWPLVKHVVWGFAGGAILVMVIIFLVYAVDTKVHDRNILEDSFELPVLGVIPDLDIVVKGKKVSKRQKRRLRKKEGSSRFILSDKTPFSIKESYRSAGTNIMYLPVESECKKFVFTSAYPREEKTVTSINISLTLAGTGKRVLLIDADMRKPMISKYLGIPATNGLSEYLSGKCASAELFRKPGSNLWIFPAGKGTSSPTELLSRDRMKDFLKWAADRFDYIIMDTPPINVVTDASVLSESVDGYLIMVRSDYSDLNDVERAIVALRQVDANLSGFVLCGVNPYSTTYGGYYGKNISKYNYQYGGYQAMANNTANAEQDGVTVNERSF